MTRNKDSDEVVEFLRLFSQLRDWIDDNPEDLPDLASKDDGTKDICLALLKAAGHLQKIERSGRKLFAAPVSSTFISAWRDFEERFGPVLLQVRANAVDAGDFRLALSLDWYEKPVSWDGADHAAREAVRAIEDTFDFACTQASANGAQPPVEWTEINVNALGGELRERYLQFRDARAATLAATDELIESMQDCDEETRRTMRKHLREESGEEEDPQRLVNFSTAQWNTLKHQAGFDLRGVFRRRALVPFVLFPRQVAAWQGQEEMLSIYQNLREAHEAFIFGTPFAALSLMRSIMEVVLRDHYGGAPGDELTLAQRIQKAGRLLPKERGKCCRIASPAKGRERNSPSRP